MDLSEVHKKIYFIFSTCVNEALLCKGIPLCENKNDLKACKLNLPNMDWRPIYFLSTCRPIDHPEYIMPFGQTVNSDFIADGRQFHCLNRGDEDPFLITNSRSNGTETNGNTPCLNNQNRWKRRCLGSRQDICVSALGNYIYMLLKIIKQSTHT